MRILQSIVSWFAFDKEKPHFVLTERYERTIGKNASSESANQRNNSPSLTDNVNALKKIFCSDVQNDLIVRTFRLGGRIDAAVLYINGLSDSIAINDFILRDCMRAVLPKELQSLVCYTTDNIITIGEVKQSDMLSDAIKAITDGMCVVFIEGEKTCIIADTRSFPDRSVTTSENEKSVYGPKDAFTENIRTNISLIRRHVHTSDLVCEMRPCGEESNTTVGIVYRDSTADKSLVNEIKKRIAEIKIHDVQSTGMIAQLTDKSPLSPIPQTLLTERPDRCASYLHEGHVVILCDGSPMAAIAPVTLFSLLSTAEDTYAKLPVGNIMRFIRVIGALISVTVPGIFIAIAMYHQGFLSSEIINTLIASRKMVFIPIGAELLLLLLVFQLVREAGMRVPGSIGQAIGIIGGLVLGQAVVAANLASSVVLILVALTGLGSFCIPDYTTQLASAYFRILFVIAGWAGGFLGFGAAMLVFIAYLAGMKSYGVPFLTPFAPKTHTKRKCLFRGLIGGKNGEDYMQTEG